MGSVLRNFSMQAVYCLLFFVSISDACSPSFFNAFFNAIMNPSTPAPTPSPTNPTNPPSTSCKCGEANRIQKIVGGVETEENEYPWQVGLLSNSWSTQPFCGGTLISSKEVLTAAHCTASGSANYVVLGEHHVENDDGQLVVEVCNVIDHASYDASTTDYDFSILRLCESVDFVKEIKPACLPPSTITPDDYDNVEAVTSGWGTLSSGGSSPDVLHEVTVNTMSNAQCTASPNVYSSSQITERMICAGGTNKDACQGDSGGPLVTKGSESYYTLIGVVSWGYGCAQEGAPGVYSRVTNQLSWINNNIQGETCST